VRLGISWDVPAGEDTRFVWRSVMTELTTADGLGIDSAWVEEGREHDAACSAPAAVLAFAARRTTSIQLRAAGRRLAGTNIVRVAEEMAVLDTFARGRAGLAVGSPHREAAEAPVVIERIDFLLSAWSSDELRYRGASFRFPASTGDDAPDGASYPAPGTPYRPQWEWGPATPPYLAVTPKPYASRLPVYVEIDDPTILEWAAETGVSPYVGPDVPTATAVELLADYWQRASRAVRKPYEVEAVIERRIDPGGDGDGGTLGGSPADIVSAIRNLRVEADVSHLVWRRTPEQRGRVAQLSAYASEIQPLCQA
jgi:alkanesulfonate monooxygenase SsuD/methylene tetrahydromethanopterin reductase-like flavin-dependent oxidoreductase (luciferase family)